MKNKMLSIMLVLLMALLFTGISVGSLDINGTVNISDTQTNSTGLYIGAASAGTLIIQSGGDFTETGITRLGEDFEGTIEVQVGGSISLDGEVLAPEGGGTSTFNVYGGAYAEQLKMAENPGDTATAVVGDGTNATTLTVRELIVGKDGNANLTINLGSAMFIEGYAVPSADGFQIGSGGVVNLVGGTLYVEKNIVLELDGTIIGYHGQGTVTSEVIGDYTVYTTTTPGTIVDAGNDVNTFLTDGSVDVTMNGSVESGGSTINSWTFTKDPVGIADPTFSVPADALDVTVTFTEAGTYTLTLTADDGEGLVSDSLVVDVVGDAIKETPWLAGVTTDSVYVCLEGSSTANATVDYGLTTGYGSSASTATTGSSYDATSGGPGSYVHNVRLTGLQPNTVYNYQVTHGSSVSSNYTFRTAPAPGTPAHFGFAADSRTDFYNHNLVAAHIALQNPNMMIYGGDLCDSDTYASWTNEWFVPNQVTLNATAPFVNAPGNHEGWGINTRAFTESPSGTDGEGGNGYFSYDYGDVHILVLNNEISDSQGSAQWNFAAADLAASNAKFKIVAAHKPAVSYGSHGSDPGMANMNTQLFEPYGVSFVLVGHDHFYQHNEKNGIYHMVIGTMGVEPRDPGTGEFEVYSEKTECFGIFDTDGDDTLTLRTYRWTEDPTQQTIGESTLIETLVVVAGPPDTDPPTPDPATFASAPAADSDTAISMTATTGTDTSGPVQYYFDETSGNPGGTDSGWQTSTSYTDTGLTASTKYTFPVQIRV